jgi:hypothetical protein
VALNPLISRGFPPRQSAAGRAPHRGRYRVSTGLFPSAHQCAFPRIKIIPWQHLQQGQDDERTKRTPCPARPPDGGPHAKEDVSRAGRHASRNSTSYDVTCHSAAACIRNLVALGLLSEISSAISGAGSALATASRTPLCRFMRTNERRRHCTSMQ